MIVAYSARTGTIRNLDALRAAGWRLLVSATGEWRTEGFPYAIDNGAWTAYQAGRQLDVELFLELLDLLGDGADWAALPDIVGGGLVSLQLSLMWMPASLAQCRRVLIPVQEGIEPHHIIPFLHERVGIFVGGMSDAWKLGTMPQWARLAREHGTWCHVGRVNSQKRIRACAAAGVHSFDGSGTAKFVKMIHRLDRTVKQLEGQGHLLDTITPTEKS
jgi:hypothetical protein